MLTHNTPVKKLLVARYFQMSTTFQFTENTFLYMLYWVFFYFSNYTQKWIELGPLEFFLTLLMVCVFGFDRVEIIQ